MSGGLAGAALPLALAHTWGGEKHELEAQPWRVVGSYLAAVHPQAGGQGERELAEMEVGGKAILKL